MLTVILDDEQEITASYTMFLKRNGITDYLVYNDPALFLSELNSINPAVILLDLQMPFYSGETVLENVKKLYPETAVIIVTGSTDIESAVRCMQKGAMDYLVKPVDKDRLAAVYTNAVNTYRMQTEISALRSALNSSKDTGFCNFHGIMTLSEKMTELFKYIEAVSVSSFPVLISGETGVGKELFAKAVHECSGRKGRFVPVNVSGLDDTMFSDTLFGHIKGAFTGAEKPRKGLIAEAEHGTLFLDEIGDLNESAQIKLLRTIQERVYMPLGSDKNLMSDVRIVAATNANLAEKVKQGLFRQDLLFRLSTHSIFIPPLRERQSDIALLAAHFYQEALTQLNRPSASALSDNIINMISGYSFPGNVRQLQALMTDIAAVYSAKASDKEITSYLAKHGIDNKNSKCPNNTPFTYSGCFPTLKEMENYLVDASIKYSAGNISLAAKLLGITRQALHKRIKPS